MQPAVIYAHTSDHIRYYKITWFQTSVVWRCSWVAPSSLLGWNNSTTLAGQPPYCQGHPVCHLVTHIQVLDPDSDLPPTAAGGFHVHGIERPGPSVGDTSTWCRLYYLQLRKYKLLELQLWGHEIPACSIWLRTSPTLVIENLEVKTCKSKKVPRWFSDLQSQRLTTDCDKATLSFKISMMRTVLSFKPQWSCTLFHCPPRFRHVLYWESLPKWEGLGNDPDAFLASSSALRMAATWS